MVWDTRRGFESAKCYPRRVIYDLCMIYYGTLTDQSVSLQRHELNPLSKGIHVPKPNLLLPRFEIASQNSMATYIERSDASAKPTAIKTPRHRILLSYSLLKQFSAYVYRAKSHVNLSI